MKRLILKFGGTSVGTIEKIKKVANIIKNRFSEGNEIIVVVSAMSGVTDELKAKSNLISKNFDNKELDVLLSSGEQVSCSLLSGALIDLGVKARSWLGWQIPIITNDNYTSSQIMKIKTDEILNFISKKGIAVIAGFQGISKEIRITTLGRGGSDLSAVAIAKFFKTDFCEIYTDVQGVLTTDPSINNNAKKIDKISYEEMLEMASLGAKVMQPTSLQDARLNRINVDVKSSFTNKSGTLITKRKNILSNKTIAGLTSTKNDAKVTLVGVKDKPGVAASVFKPLSQNYINIDMVVQTSSGNKKETDITFTIKLDDLLKTLKLIKQNKKIKYRDLIVN